MFLYYVANFENQTCAQSNCCVWTIPPSWAILTIGSPSPWGTTILPPQKNRPSMKANSLKMLVQGFMFMSFKSNSFSWKQKASFCTSMSFSVIFTSSSLFMAWGMSFALTKFRYCFTSLAVPCLFFVQSLWGNEHLDV